MKYLLPLILVISLAIVGIFVWQNYSQRTAAPNAQQNNQPTEENVQQNEQMVSENAVFSTLKKSAHYELNTPEHGATLAGVPLEVVINFNFDLAKPSEINITKNGVGGLEYGVGETIIDDNKLTMRRKIDPAAPDQTYTVSYKACWPDGSCHDGNFQFAIDRTKAASFDNQTNKKEVTIKMSQIKFMPTDLRITKGTKVIWVNDESIEHYVNTDSHPAHTYYPEQDSKALKKGEKYSVTFDQPGIYPYHCSAHAANMKGNILVE